MSEIRVVLADDHVVLRAGLLALLEAEMGIEVVGEASTGDEAVDLVRELKPTVVVMDLSMPGSGGLEATRRIRAEAGRRDVPILAMTAGAYAEDREACLAAGMNDFVAKPVLPDVLYTALARWLPAAHGPCAVPRS